MSLDPAAPEPQFFDLHRDDDAGLAAEAAAGLLAARAAVSPKFFYDALGSRLFDAITELDEYYPTRVEASIFEQQREAIAAAARKLVGPAPTLVDLGAGNGAKAAGWFAALGVARYVAVDISTSFLRDALAALQRRHPRVELIGVGLDFSQRLELPAGLIDEPALVFYPGSSIGNFAPEAALSLLVQAREASRGGALLIGVDLVKPRDVLERAYDDALGVTAAFNLNVLRRLNRLLDADFEIGDWQHVARFDAPAGRIEMHLQARRDLVVRWRGGAAGAQERRFVAGERIHTENSYKWRRADFESLLRDAGFRSVQHWTDPREWFGVFLASG